MKIVLIIGFTLASISFTRAQINEETSIGTLSGSIESNQNNTKGESNEVIPSGTAVLGQETIPSGYRYTFVSNREFDEVLKDRWEYRFPISFPYILSFTMDVATQSVVIELSDTHTTEELLKLVKRFNYVGYQID